MSLPDGRHFKVSEAACHDGTPYPEAWAEQWAQSRTLADECRDEWGDQLEAVSWYRSEAWNEHLIRQDEAKGAHGVASGSLHVKGLAIDLRPIGGGDASALHRKLLRAKKAGRLEGMGGIALYPHSNWVHVDTFKPADGHLRRWKGR